jgi:ribosomal protein S18 acetylase RimI-like enzyme
MTNVPQPWTIRPARDDDAPVVVEFNAKLAEESEQKQLDDAVLTRGVAMLLNRPELGRYFVAEVDGQIIGQIMITYEWSDWRCGQFWWIQSVYVVPEYRQRGVFRSLFQHVESAAQTDGGVCGLRLYVERENEAAIATYQRMQMKPAGYHVYERDWSGAVRSV